MEKHPYCPPCLQNWIGSCRAFLPTEDFSSVPHYFFFYLLLPLQPKVLLLRILAYRRRRGKTFSQRMIYYSSSIFYNAVYLILYPVSNNSQLESVYMGNYRIICLLLYSSIFQKFPSFLFIAKTPLCFTALHTMVDCL